MYNILKEREEERGRALYLRGFVFFALLFFLGMSPIGIASAWAGPTAAPPGNKVAAPINTGPADQTRDGWLGLTNSFSGNALSIIGNAIMSGASCSVHGANGDSWTGTSSTGHMSSPSKARPSTRYTASASPTPSLPPSTSRRPSTSFRCSKSSNPRGSVLSKNVLDDPFCHRLL